jgi:hypothetical protein
MQLTDEQIRETVAALRMAEPLKAALVERAQAGDPGARFVVYAAWRKSKASRPSACP